jgi:hypothetical protein
VTETTWDAWRTRLAHELSTLEDREFVIVGEPALEPGPPRGIFRRRPDPPPNRFVQFLWVEESSAFTAECVGASLFGGYVDIAPEDHERLRALGWNAPGDTPEPQWGDLNYRRFAPRQESDELAQLAVDSLQVLGLAPTDLVLTRDR